jgi:hypothetical protein
MRPRFLLILAVFTVCCLFSTAAYSQEDMTAIDNQVFESPKRPPAVFRHDQHNESAAIEECNLCHHLL